MNLTRADKLEARDSTNHALAMDIENNERENVNAMFH